MTSERAEPFKETTGGAVEDSTRRSPDRTRRVAAGVPPVVEFRDLRAIGLGRYLRAARLNKGWSYEELCRRSGLDRVTIIALELGLMRQDQIHISWLAKIARPLDQDVDELCLLLGIPLPLDPAQAEDGTTPFAYLVAPANPLSAGPPATPKPRTYLGAGLANSRDRYRRSRPPRDPNRQFFDK